MRDSMITLLSSCAILGMIPAKIAESKGKSYWGWYVYGVLLFLIALIHSIAMSPTEEKKRADKQADGFVICPACQEMVNPKATVCAHCGCAISPDYVVASHNEWEDRQIHGESTVGRWIGRTAFAVVLFLILGCWINFNVNMH